MKKIFSIILITLILLFSSACLENKYVSNDGGITLGLGEDFTTYMEGQTIPTFTFAYDGNLNTLAGVNYPFYTSFCQNDDLVLSRTIASLLEHYKDDVTIVVDERKATSKTHLNIIEGEKRVKQKIFTDDNVRYYETAYIYLDNGLQLVMTYCRFLYNGETIYRWRETKNIEMKLLYPLMVINDNDKRQFVITPLPYGFTMHVSGSSTIMADKIMADDKYANNIDEDNIYYTYDYNDDLTEEESVEFVTNYYVKYMNATRVDNTLLFSYNGYNFKVMLYDKFFCIRYMGKVDA